ncbi:patatin-like phospholipase family protein [Sphingomonas sp. TX0522]|uniref:patatin-like phospholipase family protein n=1 Tax=Sphingomonas sp. TX0522 TaxID=2479205 RepID=UPI0018DEF390
MTDSAGAPPSELPRYVADEFATPRGECDIVMKGGITSGIVYPYAILEIARVNRFRSIGGTSAGAIAAAFAAAAEYSRTVRKDPAGYVRLQRACDELPSRLADLFQPAPRFRPLMRHLLRSQRWRRGSSIWALPISFPLQSVAGCAIGGGALRLLHAGAAGVVLGAAVGTVVAIGVAIARAVFRHLPQADYGMCPGLGQPGGRGEALTEWMHSSIQAIAFGAEAPQAPALTFGDLVGDDPANPAVTLRMVTTNLSMGRPHTLPRLDLQAGFDPAEWRALFPKAVVDGLEASSPDFRRLAGMKAFPDEARLPVVVAARMSLAFPILFTAVPVHVRDFATAALMRATGAKPIIRKARLLMADGGISSNFPIHLFDALLPKRPTFALSLEDLPKGRVGARRVFIPAHAGQGVGLPAVGAPRLLDYAWRVLASAKDWQDQLLSTMPGQRERIAHVLLSEEEGGLNLSMPPERSLRLMRYGLEAGRRFAEGALDFDDHRWRRALVAYDQLEWTVASTGAAWRAGFGAWLRAYMDDPASYRGLSGRDRERVHQRLGAFAELDETFTPGLPGKRRKLPRPTGRLRIGPDF